MNDSGGMGILGVIIGAILVLGIIYVAFGDRMGLRNSGPSTTIKVEAPKLPSPVTK
jgi:hypothetical protein